MTSRLCQAVMMHFQNEEAHFAGSADVPSATRRQARSISVIRSIRASRSLRTGRPRSRHNVHGSSQKCTITLHHYLTDEIIDTRNMDLIRCPPASDQLILVIKRPCATHIPRSCLYTKPTQAGPAEARLPLDQHLAL